MIKRQPLSPAALATLNEVIRKFCEDVERRKAPVGVLAALNEQPREA